MGQKQQKLDDEQIAERLSHLNLTGIPNQTYALSLLKSGRIEEELQGHCLIFGEAEDLREWRPNCEETEASSLKG